MSKNYKKTSNITTAIAVSVILDLLLVALSFLLWRFEVINLFHYWGIYLLIPAITTLLSMGFNIGVLLLSIVGTGEILLRVMNDYLLAMAITFVIAAVLGIFGLLSNKKHR